MSTIAAGTTTGTALVNTGNTTGTLVFQTNGTTTALTLGTDQTATFVGAVTAPSFSGTSSTATNLAGGSNGTIPYQSASGTTAMLAVGTSGQVLTSAGAAAPTWGTVSAGYTLGTPVATTSGTIISFTGIPTGVKQVVINFKNVSSNSVGNFSIQLGTSAGIRTSGYNASAVGVGTGPSIVTDTSDTLFVLTGSKAAINFFWGSITLTLENSTNNTWVSSGLLNSDSSVKANMSAGYVNLPGVLTQLQIQALGDTFDSGEINIAYI